MLKVDNLNIDLRVNKKTLKMIEKVSFEIDEGNIYSIVGKNGSGKSTLIKGLTNLLNKKEFKITGKVFWNSEDLISADCKKILHLRQNEIKYLFQDAISCFDPIKKMEYYFRGIEREKINSIFNELNLEDFDRIKNLYPNQISNGMAQRISLALALLAEAKLIFLDEPTSALDYFSQKAIFDCLKVFKQEKNGIVLLITQEISFAEKISDKIAFMQEGELSEFFEVSELYDIKENNYVNSIIGAYKKIK